MEMRAEEFQSLYRRYAYALYRDVFEVLKDIDDTRDVIYRVFDRLRAEGAGDGDPEQQIYAYRDRFVAEQKKARLDVGRVWYQLQNDEILGRSRSYTKVVKAEPEPQAAEEMEVPMEKNVIETVEEAEKPAKTPVDEAPVVVIEAEKAGEPVAEVPAAEAEKIEESLQEVPEETEASTPRKIREIPPEELEEKERCETAETRESEPAEEAPEQTEAEAGEQEEAETVEQEETETEEQEEKPKKKAPWWSWVLGVILVLLILVFVWELANLLMAAEVIPTVDLGYSWFNQNIFELFPVETAAPTLVP